MKIMHMLVKLLLVKITIFTAIAEFDNSVCHIQFVTLLLKCLL